MNFSARIHKIGVNPYVFLPGIVLQNLFAESGKDRGPIPVILIINMQSFTQNLVKFHNKWRLYLNTPMRKAAGKDVGDIIDIDLEFDNKERVTPMHPRLLIALQNNAKAKHRFDQLRPSLQKEILRYINLLKTEESVDKNVQKAINFLSGTGRFIGRDAL